MKNDIIKMTKALLNKIKSLVREKKFAWAQVFQREDAIFEEQVRHNNLVKDILDNVESKLNDNENIISYLRKRMEEGFYRDLSCPICVEEIGSDNKRVLRCGHFIHRECLEDLYNHAREHRTKATCPTCRRPI